MKVFKTKKGLITHVIDQKQAGFSVGLVPTMGALHQGHFSLVKAALNSNKCVVVSIFVNPTQFNISDDLNKYPRTLDKDIKLLETLSRRSIVVYAPSIEDVYGTKMSADCFDFDGLELEMEGRFRVGHFNGVGTIVKRLFEIVNPNNSYFGEKDFQQLQIIKKMVKITKLPVKVIGCPIEREPNGLAMSSRNTRLNALERDESALIFKTLKLVKQKFKTDGVQAICSWVDTQFSTHPLFELEYFQISEVETLAAIEQKNTNKTCRAFIAVLVRDIRLIDNIDLN